MITKITCLVCGKRYNISKGQKVLDCIKDHEKNNCKKVTKQLDEIDNQYPNILRAPKHIRDSYNELSIKLIGSVWDSRTERHGSIHSHLKAGEKDGM